MFALAVTQKSKKKKSLPSQTKASAWQLYCPKLRKIDHVSNWKSNANGEGVGRCLSVTDPHKNVGL